MNGVSFMEKLLDGMEVEWKALVRIEQLRSEIDLIVAEIEGA